MLIHDGGGGDGPTVDAHTYEKLTVSELEQALHVDAGAITTAADQWGNLHDVLDDFLGKTIPGPDAFPVLVAKTRLCSVQRPPRAEPQFPLIAAMNAQRLTSPCRQFENAA